MSEDENYSNSLRPNLLNFSYLSMFPPIINDFQIILSHTQSPTFLKSVRATNYSANKDFGTVVMIFWECFYSGMSITKFEFSMRVMRRTPSQYIVDVMKPEDGPKNEWLHIVIHEHTRVIHASWFVKNSVTTMPTQRCK